MRTVCTDGTEHNRKLFSRGLPALSDRVNLITLVQSNSEFSSDIDIIFINCRQTSLRLVFVCPFVRQSYNRINFCTNGAKLFVCLLQLLVGFQIVRLKERGAKSNLITANYTHVCRIISLSLFLLRFTVTAMPFFLFLFGKRFLP